MPLLRRFREQRLHPFDDLTRSRIPEAIRVDDLSVINVDAKLAKSTSYYFNVGFCFLPQLGCHTGSHGLLDWSNRAVMYFYFSHNCAAPEVQRYYRRLAHLLIRGHGCGCCSRITPSISDAHNPL